MKHLLKILSLCLCLCLCLSALVSCASKPTDSRIKGNTVVGSVDGEDVYYDELYYLATNYLPALEGSSDKNAALDRFVRENILINYAILKLCESVGYSYDMDELEEEAKSEIEATLELTFDNDEELFKESLKDDHLTERYLNHSIQVDLLYDRLLIHYPQVGLVEDDADAMRAYIKENFVRVIQIMNPSLDTITPVYEQLKNGTLSMYKAIGNTTVNQDMGGDITGNGYYFCRGVMEKEYEDAAFALRVGEISEIVTADGERPDGSYGTCYYVLQRLALEDSYISENFTALLNQYYGVEIANDLNEIKATLSFVPNDFYTELDLSDLPEAYDAPSYTGLIVGIVVGALVLIGAATVTVILLKKKHAKKNVGVRRV